MQILVYYDFVNIFQEIKNLLKIKFIRFLFVGSANTAISFLTFSFFYYIGFHYTIATFLNLIIGIFISFNTHKHITFLSNSKKFKIYIFFALLFYAITNALLYLADSYNLNIYFSYLLILLPIAICNFFILRRFVFNS
jgi:putative flippase GtrA